MSDPQQERLRRLYASSIKAKEEYEAHERLLFRLSIAIIVLATAMAFGVYFAWGPL